MKSQLGYSSGTKVRSIAAAFLRLKGAQRVKEVAILVRHFSLGSFDTVLSSSAGNDRHRAAEAGETVHAWIDSS